MCKENRSATSKLLLSDAQSHLTVLRVSLAVCAISCRTMHCARTRTHTRRTYVCHAVTMEFVLCCVGYMSQRHVHCTCEIACTGTSLPATHDTVDCRHVHACAPVPFDPSVLALSRGFSCARHCVAVLLSASLCCGRWSLCHSLARRQRFTAKKIKQKPARWLFFV